MIAGETNLLIATKKAVKNLPTRDCTQLLPWMRTALKNAEPDTLFEDETEGTLVGSIKAAFVELSHAEKESLITWADRR